jgi:hypothetical protein
MASHLLMIDDGFRELYASQGVASSTGASAYRQAAQRFRGFSWSTALSDVRIAGTKHLSTL